MSRSKKDGRRGGGHRSSMKEIWSKRCKKVNMWRPGRDAKDITHRIERRKAKEEIRDV